MKRIVAIEDDPGIASVYQKILGQLDYEVVVAPDVAEAFALLSEPAARYDLVIADLCLPDGSFYEAAATDAWRPLISRYPFLAVSVVDDLSVLQECLASWADDYLVKPFNNNELIAKCEKMVGDSLRLDTGRMVLTHGGRESQELTAKEFKMMAYLLAQKGWQSDTTQLLKAVWGDENGTQKLHTGISRLRTKIRPLGVDVTLNSEGLFTVTMADLSHE